MNMFKYCLVCFQPVIAVSFAVFSSIPAFGEPVSTSGKYRNLFTEFGIASEEEVNERIDQVVDQFFYGNSENEKIYYETAGGDMAFILDTGNNDIRSEGMSYGMMFCVQLDMKKEFDKLWKFAHDKMQHASGEMDGYFAWHVSPEEPYKVLSPYSAPDGEEYFALALFMASNRWGDGEGIFNYRAEANKILDHMAGHRELLGLTSSSEMKNMIDPVQKMIVFVPSGRNASFTDPSYHLPHFYELFALWAENNNQFWHEVAEQSRRFLQKTCHPGTGLAPDYAYFNGKPYTGMGDHNRFKYDAWRVAMNISLDYYWWEKDSWQKDVWVKNYLNFFRKEGIETYTNIYNINGSRGEGYHSSGLVAMNAVTALIAGEAVSRDFVIAFWNTYPDIGTWRYYNNCLYLFALLNLSGRYRIISE